MFYFLLLFSGWCCQSLPLAPPVSPECGNLPDLWSHYDHITLVLEALRWLLVQNRMAVLVWKCSPSLTGWPLCTSCLSSRSSAPTIGIVVWFTAGACVHQQLSAVSQLTTNITVSRLKTSVPALILLSQQFLATLPARPATWHCCLPHSSWRQI